MIPPILLDRLLVLALAEDLAAGDVTMEAVVEPDRNAVGRFVARAPAVLAGTAAAARVFALVDPRIEIAFAAGDGTALERGEAFGRAAGRASSLLAAERTALNLLQRLS